MYTSVCVQVEGYNSLSFAARLLNIFHWSVSCLVLYTMYKCKNHSEYGCRDAPCEKSWKQGASVSSLHRESTDSLIIVGLFTHTRTCTRTRTRTHTHTHAHAHTHHAQRSGGPLTLSLSLAVERRRSNQTPSSQAGAPSDANSASLTHTGTLSR